MSSTCWKYRLNLLPENAASIIDSWLDVSVVRPDVFASKLAPTVKCQLQTVVGARLLAKLNYRVLKRLLTHREPRSSRPSGFPPRPSPGTMPRMTTMPPLPDCCPALSRHWPLPFVVPGANLVGGCFDPRKLAGDDFLRCAIEPPASIGRSVAKRQTEFLAGRLCAREAMRQLDGRAYVPGVAEDRAPVWPEDICGSITHSTGWAAAIVAHKAQWRGLGLDAETLLSHERATRLAKEILTAAELADMATGPQDQIALRVTLTFSIKEALFKALYPIVRKRFYFQDAQLLEWREDGSARLRLLADLSTEWHSGMELDGQFCLSDTQLLSLISIAA